MERQIRSRHPETGNLLKFMKRVLVTGATGFLGQFCLRPLAAKGYEIHAVSRNLPADNKNSSDLDVQWHQADLLDAERTARLVNAIEPTHLLHLAWHIEHGKHYAAPENFAWVCASLALFEAFAAIGGRRAVCAGTAAEYSWTEENVYEEYRTPLSPATTYGKCKHALQILLEAYAEQFEISFAWGRAFFLYGPEDRTNRLVPSVIRSLLQGKPALCSHGNQIRDFLYIDDAAQALVSLLDSDVRGSVNIASGIPISPKEIIFAIGDIIGNKELIKLGAIKSSVGESSQIVADVNRLRNEVGWCPRLTLAEGLAETVEWWRANLNDLKVEKL